MSRKPKPELCGIQPYQLMTDKAAYEIFALAGPDLAEVTAIEIFVKYRPWNVVPPNQRTSM
jgi:hypothetical protein